MPKIKNIDEAKLEFSKRKLTLISDNYINSKTKMDCIDEFGYLYSLSLGNIKDNRVLKFDIVSKWNKFSNENIQKFLEINGSNSILKSEYINNDSKLKLKCECGYIYEASWNHIRNLNNMKCQKCAEKDRHINKKLKKEEIEKIFNNTNFKLLKYNNAHSVEVEDLDGYRYLTSIYNLDKNGLKFHKNNPYTLYNIDKYIKDNNIPIRIDFEEIKNNNIEISKFYFPCCCSECDNKYYATWSQITLDKRYRCKKCSKKESSLELEVENHLKTKGVKYEKQKKFEKCKVKKCLPFDFYLVDCNCVIEVQGRQHYYEAKNFTRTLEEQKMYDKIKKDYCVDNGIKFIEIPYYLINNKKYKQIIDNILK